jgi:hypothetical protein
MLNVYRVITTRNDKAKNGFGFVEQIEPISKHVFPVKNIMSVVGNEKKFQMFLKWYFNMHPGPLSVKIGSSFHPAMFPQNYNHKNIEKIVFMSQSDCLVSDEEAKKVYFIEPEDIFHNGEGYQMGITKLILKGSKLVDRGGKKSLVWFHSNTYYPQKENPLGNSSILYGNINVQDAHTITILENKKIKKVYSLPTASQLERIIPKEYHKFILKEGINSKV